MNFTSVNAVICRLWKLDAYGERLRVCLGCNCWQAVTPTDEWLPEDDIEKFERSLRRADFSRDPFL